MASLVVTDHYNTSVSEQLRVCSVWSSGTTEAYRERRFGCREIKVPSAPIFFLIQFTNMLFYYCYKPKGFFLIYSSSYRVCNGTHPSHSSTLHFCDVVFSWYLPEMCAARHDIIIIILAGMAVFFTWLATS